MRRTLYIFAIALISCSVSEKKELTEIIDKSDKILIDYSVDNHKLHLAKFLTKNETANFKSSILINNITIEGTKKLDPKNCIPSFPRKILYRITLFNDNQPIGDLFVEKPGHNEVTFVIPNLQITFNTGFDLNQYLDTFLIGKNMNCSETFPPIVRLENLSLYEFIDVLKIKNPCPNGVYQIMIIRNAPDNWIKEKDIPYLISLLDSNEITYCITQACSSKLPDDTDYSTLGGQIMNMIDSYRLQRPYPDFLTACTKNDEERKKEIIKWWKN